MINYLEREKFEAWLFTQSEERIFEYRSCTRCMVASFLKETTNIPVPLVGPENFYTHTELISIPFPEWLIILINRVRLYNHSYIQIKNLKQTYLDQFPSTNDLDLSGSIEPKGVEVSGGKD